MKFNFTVLGTLSKTMGFTKKTKKCIKNRFYSFYLCVYESNKHFGVKGVIPRPSRRPCCRWLGVKKFSDFFPSLSWLLSWIYYKNKSQIFTMEIADSGRDWFKPITFNHITCINLKNYYRSYKWILSQMLLHCSVTKGVFQFDQASILYLK